MKKENMYNNLSEYFTNLAINSECLSISQVSRRGGPKTVIAVMRVINIK